MTFVQRAARRFMPGEEPEDALREAAGLDERGAGTILTLLGENVDDRATARGVVDHYVDLLGTIRSRGLDTELSVKPTQLGLDLGRDVAAEGLADLVRAAGEDGTMVWIDMESSPYVDPTLELFRSLREEHENVGVCLQAYLYRTEADLEALFPLAPAIRLVKGAYREPTDLAYPRKSDVDANFMKLAAILLRARAEGRVGRPGIATHDSRILRDVATLAEREGVEPEAWEFEMLYGIGLADQAWALEAGHGLRVLISYGSHWFPWYMRRLAERPANLWFVARKLVG
jgi:proline dehydrogenase